MYDIRLVFVNSTLAHNCTWLIRYAIMQENKVKVCTSGLLYLVVLKGIIKQYAVDLCSDLITWILLYNTHILYSYQLWTLVRNKVLSSARQFYSTNEPLHRFSAFWLRSKCCLRHALHILGKPRIAAAAGGWTVRASTRIFNDAVREHGKVWVCYRFPGTHTRKYAWHRNHPTPRTVSER
jgi:hypothetical protein